MVSRFCTRCGQLLPANATVCPRCNAPVGASAGVSAGTPAAAPGVTVGDAGSAARRTCANCRAPMRWVGQYSLRATAAGGSAQSSGAAEGTETLLPFSLYYCQTCGKFDLYYPGT